MKVIKKKCQHNWQLSHTDWQYPSGYTGTVVAEEYAYLFCKKCLQVIKKKVEYR